MNSIPGSKTLLVGGTGTGKTHCLASFIEAGITPFVLFTENGMRTVSEHKCPDLHYKYVAPGNVSWDDMISSAQKINQLSFQNLAKLDAINKNKFTQFMQVLTTCNNFVCDRCGESFGDISSWGTDRALCLDSLSGLNLMAMDLVVGSKPTKSMSDWGVAMDNLERFINKLAMELNCHFVLTAHLEQERDEVTGGIKLMASTLGRKLAPRLPRFFDDVVQCLRTGTTFHWSTASTQTDVKARNLPMSDNLPPTFLTLIESWKKAGGIIDGN